MSKDLQTFLTGNCPLTSVSPQQLTTRQIDIPKPISLIPLLFLVKNDGLRLPDLFNNPLYSDVTVVSNDDRSFYAHRLILSSVPYFEGLFRAKMQENNTNSIRFPDIDGNSLEMIIQILYGVPGDYDIDDYVILYMHADRLSSRTLCEYAYKQIRSCLDKNCHIASALAQALTHSPEQSSGEWVGASERKEVLRDLIENYEMLFDIDLGFRLIKDYYCDGFKEALISLSDVTFERVMMKLIPFVARDGLNPYARDIPKKSHDEDDLLSILDLWLYRDFSDYDTCRLSVQRKLPLYRQLILSYMTIQPSVILSNLLAQKDDSFLPERRLFGDAPYRPDKTHMILTTRLPRQPVRWILIPNDPPHTYIKIQ